MEFTNEQLQQAMEKIAKDEVPGWMNAIEKQAFALGVITKEDIVQHNTCNGRGERNSYDGPDCMARCMACNGTGVVISDQGKAKIKTAFPEYKMRDFQDD